MVGSFKKSNPIRSPLKKGTFPSAFVQKMGPRKGRLEVFFLIEGEGPTGGDRVTKGETSAMRTARESTVKTLIVRETLTVRW